MSAATAWSTRPLRLVEMIFPRFFGDPTRDDEDLYFGWRMHDNNFPFVESIYPGTLLLLGTAGSLLLPIRRRWAWRLGLGASVFLALGHHNPLFLFLFEIAPPLRILRYPERFLLLAVAFVVFAGALTLDFLLAERAADRRLRAELPLALGLVLLVTSGTLATSLQLAPRLASWFVSAHLPLPPPQSVLDRGISFLRHEAWIATGVAAAAVLWFALVRFSRLSNRALGLLAVGILALDLGYYRQRLLPLEPAAILLAPTLVAGPLRESPDRIFSNIAFDRRPELFLRPWRPNRASLVTRLHRLDPYSGNLWGLAYVLHEDYDLMLTDWARHALAVLHADHEVPTVARRLIGAWNGGTLVIRRSSEELVSEGLATGTFPVPARLERNPFLLPRYRFVSRGTTFPSREDAFAAARARSYPLADQEFLVEPEAQQPPTETTWALAPQVLKVNEEGDRVRVSYRASAPALLVAAMTYHEDWRAEVEGRPLSILPTAIGQMALVVPAGEHELRMAFRDPWVPVGASVSALTLFVAFFLWHRSPLLGS